MTLKRLGGRLEHHCLFRSLHYSTSRLSDQNCLFYPVQLSSLITWCKRRAFDNFHRRQKWHLPQIGPTGKTLNIPEPGADCPEPHGNLRLDFLRESQLPGSFFSWVRAHSLYQRLVIEHRATLGPRKLRSDWYLGKWMRHSRFSGAPVFKRHNGQLATLGTRLAGCSCLDILPRRRF